MYLHSGEAVVEVLAEFALGYGCLQVDIRCRHDTHACALHRRRAYFEKLAALEHSQQASLRGEGQLGYLVEKDGAAVGLLEISFTRIHGTGESAFLVSEKLRVDGALGDCAAVYGDVFGMLAGAERVDYLREKLFARAALAGDKHR